MPLTEEDVCDTADLLVPFTPFLLTYETRGIAIAIRLRYKMKISFFRFVTTKASDIMWWMKELVVAPNVLTLPSVENLLESVIRLLLAEK